MKTYQELEDRIDKMLDVAEERSPAGEKGEAWNKLFKAQELLASVDKVTKAKQNSLGKEYVGNWEAIWRVPTAVFGPQAVSMPKMSWTCPDGHTFKAKIGQIKASLDAKEEPCGYCRRNMALAAGPAFVHAARVKYYMMHDERGEDMILDMYEESNFKHPYTDRVSGEHYTTYAVNLQNWSRPQSKSKPVVWIVEDGAYAFLWTGDEPVVNNPVIKDLINRGHDINDRPDGRDAVIETYYAADAIYKKGYTHRSGLERAIAECVENGAKVLNIGLNPQFISPGIYQWGNLADENAALATWIKEIEAEWLDAKGGDST